MKLKMNNIFLLNCGFYRHNHRNKLLEAIKLPCKFDNFKLLSLNKLIWLLNSENINILTEICGFLLVTAYLTNKGNNKITELRTILQRESQNS